MPFDERHHRAAAASVQERKQKAENRALDLIMVCRERGLSLRKTAARLDRHGVWPPSAFTGNKFWRPGCKWSAEAVRRICRAHGIN